MAKTASILTERDWKRTFGELLRTIAEDQRISADVIAQRLDRLPGSKGRNRSGDWSRYVKSGRIPTEVQLVPLSEALRVPLAVLRVCAGYVDDIFECAYGVLSNGDPKTPRFACSKKRAAFAFMFSLFRRDDMLQGNVCELWSFIVGRPVRWNLNPDAGFETGPHSNSTWLYPRKPKASDLIEHRCDPKRDGVTYVSVDGRPPPKKPWSYYSIRAAMQTDLASPLAARILARPRVTIPRSEPLFEAQRLMHSKALPLFLRIDLATTIIHEWADTLDKETAREVRRDLLAHDDKTLDARAVAWIKGGCKGERPDHADFWL